MVQVPLATNNQVLTGPLSRERVADTGAGVRRATQALFGEIVDTGRAVEREADEWQTSLDTAAAKDADARFSSLVGDTLYDSESGFLYQRGQSAAEGLDGLRERLTAAYEETVSGLSPGAARAAKDALRSRLEIATRQAAGHAVTERDAWLRSSSEARRDRTVIDAAQSYGDGRLTDTMLTVAEDDILEQAEREGWAPEATALALQTHRSTHHSTVVSAFLNGGDVGGAVRYFREHETDITLFDQARLKPVIREYEVDAEARALIAGIRGGVRAPARAPGPEGIPVVEPDLDAEGYYHAPGIAYDLEGKTRDKPVSREFIQGLSATLAGLGEESLGITIVSGGQDAEGPHRTGSHRHDVDDTGHAHTADLVLTRNGKPVLPGEDPELYERFFEATAGRFPGMGHYAWGVHVGAGSEAFWGPSKTSRDADPRFVEAAARGRARGDVAAVSPDIATGETVDARAAIEAYPDPAVREVALGIIDADARRAKAEQEAAEDAARRKVYDALDRGAAWEDIPLADRVAMAPEHRSAAQGYAKARAKGDVVTDDQTYYSLRLMAADDPEQFKGEDLLQYRDGLSSSDWQELVRIQTTVREGGGHTARSYSKIRGILDTVSGGAFDWKAEGGTSGHERAMSVYIPMTRMIDAFVAEKDRMPDDAELTDMAGALMRDVTVLTPNTLFFGTVSETKVPFFEILDDVQTAFDSGEGFDIRPGIFDGGTEDDILTPEKADVIRQSLFAATQKEPTFEEIVWHFLTMRGAI